MSSLSSPGTEARDIRRGASNICSAGCTPRCARDSNPSKNWFAGCAPISTGILAWTRLRVSRDFGRDKYHCVTVKFVALAAVPPGVVMEIFPVCAPAGTVAVTPVSEFTVNAVAFTPPKVTVLV
jgi:hypothetical protein